MIIYIVKLQVDKKDIKKDNINKDKKKKIIKWEF